MKEHVADGGIVLLNRRADGVNIPARGRTRHHVADDQIASRSCMTELAMHEYLVQEARDRLHGRSQESDFIEICKCAANKMIPP